MTRIYSQTGYWQIPIRDCGIYRYNTILFDLINAPGTCQRLIQSYFDRFTGMIPLIDQSNIGMVILVYLNYLIIRSPAYEKHSDDFDKLSTICNFITSG